MTDEEIAEVANRLSRYFAEVLLDTPQDDAFVAKAQALMTGPIAAAIRHTVRLSIRRHSAGPEISPKLRAVRPQCVFIQNALPETPIK